MATRAVETLLPSGIRTGAIEGGGFWTGRRTGWTFTFNLSRLDPTSIVVRIEAAGSPYGAADDWDLIHEATLATVGETTATTGGFSGRDPTAQDLVFRARVSTVNGSGEYVLEVRGAAPWFDLTDADDLNLLSDALKRFDDAADNAGRDRIVEQAEADVLAFLGWDRAASAVDFTSPIVLQTMKAAIVTQAEHLFQVGRIRASREATALQAQRWVGPKTTELESVLSPILYGGTMPVMVHR